VGGERRYRLNGEMLTLVEINAKIETGYMEIEPSLLESVQGENILDLGCKIGVISAKIDLANPQSHVVGVDYFSTYIDIARELYKNASNIKFLPMNAYELKFEEGFFDCVCMSP
jgi:ubiquinone/menaquinone biosynthesis C-methylase UbiE